MAGKLALGSKRQAIMLAVLGAVLLLAVVKWRSGPAPAPAPEGAPSRPAATNSGEDDAPVRPARRGSSSASKPITADEVPVLDPKDFEPPKAGSGQDAGRDLFELREPTRPPAPTATPRPPLPCEAAYVGPCGPPSPTPTPRPPDISFKFLGSFGPKEHPIAVIQQGDEVFNARAGDTLFGKFVLKKVGYESIDVGFVGFAASETKRLAIAP